MFEYSDGYRKLDSENNTGAVAFSGKYTDGGSVFVGVNSYVDDNGKLNILHSYVIREPGRANTFGAGEFGDMAQSSGGEPKSIFEAAFPIALTAAAGDGPIPIGDVIGAVILAGATAYDATQRTFVTYTMRNAKGQVYVGRTSGYGDPYRIMMNRYYGHHMRASGYGNPVLDKAVQGYHGYTAIRGREQQLIDFYGGVGSSNVGNSIRGVGYYKDVLQIMHNSSNLYFGPLAPYTGFWK